MKVALIQIPLVWENPPENRKALEASIRKAPDADMYVLPEMFATGFTMNASSVAETMDGDSVQWMKRMAGETGAAIVGSLAISEAGHYFNRMLFVHPDGQLHVYDKRHLFTLAGENEVFTPGKDKVILNYKGWRVCLQVCYDLRFPAFSRNVEDYDMLIYVANWPESRIQAWDTLLKARAIENMCFVVAVNRTGRDGNGNLYCGHSQVIDHLGNVLCFGTQPGVLTAQLLREEMHQSRAKFGFLSDRDRVTVT